MFALQHLIEAVEEDNPHSSQERSFKGYLKWQQSCGPKEATCCVIVDVLDQLRMSGLRRDFQREFGMQGKICSFVLGLILRFH